MSDRTLTQWQVTIPSYKLHRTSRGKEFIVYSLSVSPPPHKTSYIVYRRYSQIYTWFKWMKSQFPSLAGIVFPSAPLFNDNTDPSFLEERRGALEEVFRKTAAVAHPALQDELAFFLDAVSSPSVFQLEPALRSGWLTPVGALGSAFAARKYGVLQFDTLFLFTSDKDTAPSEAYPMWGYYRLVLPSSGDEKSGSASYRFGLKPRWPTLPAPIWAVDSLEERERWVLVLIKTLEKSHRAFLQSVVSTKGPLGILVPHAHRRKRRIGGIGFDDSKMVVVPPPVFESDSEFEDGTPSIPFDGRDGPADLSPPAPPPPIAHGLEVGSPSLNPSPVTVQPGSGDVDLGTQLSKAKEQISTLEASLAESEKESSALRLQLNEVEGNATLAEQKWDRQIAVLEGELEDAQSNVNDLEAKLEISKQSEESLRALLRAASEAKAELETQLAEQSTHTGPGTVELGNRIEEMTGALTKLMASLEESQAKVASLEAEVETHVGRIKDLEAQLEAAKTGSPAAPSPPVPDTPAGEGKDGKDARKGGSKSSRRKGGSKRRQPALTSTVALEKQGLEKQVAELTAQNEELRRTLADVEARRVVPATSGSSPLADRIPSPPMARQTRPQSSSSMVGLGPATNGIISMAAVRASSTSSPAPLVSSPSMTSLNSSNSSATNASEDDEALDNLRQRFMDLMYENVELKDSSSSLKSQVEELGRQVATLTSELSKKRGRRRSTSRPRATRGSKADVPPVPDVPDS